MSLTPTASWPSFLPFPAQQSLPAAMAVMEHVYRHVRAPLAPTATAIWRGLMREQPLGPLELAGEALARQLDGGIGAGAGNGYHHIAHFKDVLLGAAMLTEVAAWQGKPLPGEQRSMLLLAALGHDMGHDGGRNNGTPFRLEMQSCQYLQHVMTHYEVPALQQEQIRLMVLTTDVSQGTAHLHALAKGQSHPLLEGAYVPLSLLQQPTHRHVVELAAMLRDADVLMAAGVAASVTRDQRAGLAREWNTPLPDSDHERFIGFVLTPPDGRPSFNSAAGKFFNPALRQIRQELARSARATGPKLT